MEKEKCLVYEAPVVEVIEVEVEKGFAASLYGVDPSTEMGVGTGSF